MVLRTTVLLVAVSLLLGGGAAQAALEDGLVSYWPLDGTVTDVFGGQATTHTGGTEDYAPGKFGDGILLDGGAEQIEVPEAVPGPGQAYDFGAAGNGMSMSVWTRVDAWDTSWQALLTKGEGSAFRLHRESASQTNMNWSANGDTTSSNVDVNDGQLHHIVVTHDGAASNSTKEIWIDGQLRGTVTNGGQIGDNDYPFMIGENADGGGNSREWEGLIDDVGVWGRPLTQTEIESLWNNGEGASIGSLTSDIPEPATMALMGLAACGLGGYVRRRRKRA